MTDEQIMDEIRWLITDPAISNRQARRALRYFLATIDKDIRRAFLAVEKA